MSKTNTNNTADARTDYRPPPRPPAVPAYRPFPVDLLTPAVGRFVAEAAAVVRVDAAMVALPALAALAGAVGNARRVRVHKGRDEPAVLWAAVVAKSGAGKTPAADYALAPLKARHGRLLREHDAERVEHERAVLLHKREVAEWAKGGGAGEPPDPPEPPPCRRVIVNDTTVEAMAPILLANPRGVLAAVDELATWAGSFDRYKAGGGGSDAARWLSMHNAGFINVDRKTSGTIYVPHAAVSVTGGIQPGILADVLTPERRASGLAARLLLAWPPHEPRTFPTTVVSDAAEAGYAAVLATLVELAMDAGDDGEPASRVLPMTGDAVRHFTGWFNAHHAAAAEADDDLAAAMVKLDPAAARFALLLSLAEAAECGRDAAAVELRHVVGGCALADWFAAEAARVYAMAGCGDAGRRRVERAEAVRRDFGPAGDVGVRGYQRKHHRRLATAEAARAELAGLAEAGHGELYHAPTAAAGGRPAERFRLLPTPAAADAAERGDAGDGDKTPPHAPAAGVLSPSPLSPAADTAEPGGKPAAAKPAPNRTEVRI